MKKLISGLLIWSAGGECDSENIYGWNRPSSNCIRRMKISKNHLLGGIIWSMRKFGEAN